MNPLSQFSQNDIFCSGQTINIEIAWYASIQQEPNGRKTVTTQRFVQQLSKVNWNWTMKQANEWIEWYVTTFRDVSTQEGETYLSAVQSKRRTIAMGFPSPASDYVETRISLDQQLISQPAATYFMRASRSHFREGIIQGALLVVDVSLSACDGSLLICAIDGEFRIKRYRTHPQPHLINLENGRKEALPEDGDGYNSSHAIFGVITYIINDARNAEFDDCPVM